MSTALIAACLWVVAGTLVAALPMRFQIVPGLVLLASAPVILWALAAAHGALPVAFGLFALLSMFRRPLAVLLRRLGGARAP